MNVFKLFIINDPVFAHPWNVCDVIFADAVASWWGWSKWRCFKTAKNVRILNPTLILWRWPLELFSRSMWMHEIYPMVPEFFWNFVYHTDPWMIIVKTTYKGLKLYLKWHCLFVIKFYIGFYVIILWYPCKFWIGGLSTQLVHFQSRSGYRNEPVKLQSSFYCTCKQVQTLVSVPFQIVLLPRWCDNFRNMTNVWIRGKTTTTTTCSTNIKSCFMKLFG